MVSATYTHKKSTINSIRIRKSKINNNVVLQLRYNMQVFACPNTIAIKEKNYISDRKDVDYNDSSELSHVIIYLNDRGIKW